MMGLLGHLTPIEILGRRHTRKKGTKKPKSDLSSEVSQENILEDKYKNIPY